VSADSSRTDTGIAHAGDGAGQKPELDPVLPSAVAVVVAVADGLTREPRGIERLQRGFVEAVDLALKPVEPAREHVRATARRIATPSRRPRASGWTMSVWTRRSGCGG
jgi:hypothetical protein